MKALGAQGLPVPRAVDSNRHAVLMSMVDAYPLVQVRRAGWMMGATVQRDRRGSCSTTSLSWTSGQVPVLAARLVYRLPVPEIESRAGLS